jgi:hypothetical protein
MQVMHARIAIAEAAGAVSAADVDCSFQAKAYIERGFHRLDGLLHRRLQRPGRE